MIAPARSRTGLTLRQVIQLTAVMCVLAVILYPLFTGGDRYGPRLCLSHLKALGTAMTMYSQDYDGAYPSYPPEPTPDWGSVAGGSGDGASRQWRSSSFWIAQLLPYAKDVAVFRCSQDVDPERNQKSVVVPGSATPFPVSYGPNRMFVNPAAYGRTQPVAIANVDQPADKYLLGDCITASGFDLDTIAYLRYANYDPSRRQNGWSLRQFTTEGRLALPDEQVRGLARHHMGSNIMFADGHAKWVQHDRIPNNDGPNGDQYRELHGHMVPWKPGESTGG